MSDHEIWIWLNAADMASPCIMSDASPLLQQILMGKALADKFGQEYEDFFSSFGAIHWGADFEPWKPQGSLGDFKCDGYLISEKKVFQCYAPERLEASKANTKIVDSFDGALDHFGDRMVKWCFVHNRKDGLHGTSNTLLGDLRENNPDIKIESWGPEIIMKLSRDNSNVLKHLFPEILNGSRLDTFTEDALLAHAQKIIEQRNIDGFGDHLSNQIQLSEALEILSDDDKEIRRRILGLTKWFDPASIDQIIKELVDKNFAEAAIQANIDRLCEAEIIIATRDHLLPMNQEICQEAAETLTDEMIERLA